MSAVRTSRAARRGCGQRCGLEHWIALNRRAMAAYERLDLEEALDLLREGLRAGNTSTARNRDALATTHLNMGVVLAGGFKQQGLAVKHFRLARALRPQLAPSPRLILPKWAPPTARPPAASRRLGHAWD